MSEEYLLNVNLKRIGFYKEGAKTKEKNGIINTNKDNKTNKLIISSSHSNHSNNINTKSSNTISKHKSTGIPPREGSSNSEQSALQYGIKHSKKEDSDGVNPVGGIIIFKFTNILSDQWYNKQTCNKPTVACCCSDHLRNLLSKGYDYDLEYHLRDEDKH